MALCLNTADGILRQRRTALNASVPVVVDIAKGVGDIDADLASREVDHRAHGAKDSRDAASCKPTLDQVIAEGVGVQLRVGGYLLVATDVDDIATGSFCCSLEGNRTPLPLEAEVDRYSL